MPCWLRWRQFASAELCATAAHGTSLQLSFSNSRLVKLRVTGYSEVTKVATGYESLVLVADHRELGLCGSNQLV
jgi:hypothetical protein